MATHVVEDYPAERLPEDLRRRIGAAPRVRVTLDVPADHLPTTAKLPERLGDIVGMGRKLHDTPEDVVASIRALRDEWD